MSTLNGHTQEATLISLSDTLVGHGDNGGKGAPAGQKLEIDIPQVDSPVLHATLETASPVADSPRVFPTTIPPEHTNRTLILCFDGTGDQFDADNSNIVQLVSLLKKNDQTKQMVYYQAGIGTYMSPKVATPFMSKISKTLDEMFAWNLDAHLMSGYEFLMQNYTAGDKICIFGFSRGAYTARCLAGMIHKVGLLPADNFQQVPFAYKMYTRTDHVGWEQSNEFKKAFSVDVNIEFLGVWDTVDSVGLVPKRVPFSTSNTIVRTFRHAVALDERRSKFKANLWNRPNEDEAKLGLPQRAPSNGSDFVQAATEIHNESTSSSKLKSNKTVIHKESKGDRKQSRLERMFSERTERQTDIEEVWFAGCHCDIGGGSVSNKTRHSLARIPLRWMIRECFQTGTGIMFNSEGLRGIGLDPATLYPVVAPRPPPLPLDSGKIAKAPSQAIPVRIHARLTKKKRHPELYAGLHEAAAVPYLGSEEDEELRDALSPIYDQLQLKPIWWLLEIIPLNLRYQRGDNEWVSTFGSNLARPRFIPKQKAHGVKVHRSVKMRMEAEYEDERLKGKKYSPRAKLDVEPIWID